MFMLYRFQNSRHNLFLIYFCHQQPLKDSDMRFKKAIPKVSQNGEENTCIEVLFNNVVC